jgi:hypothetical protein
MPSINTPKPSTRLPTAYRQETAIPTPLPTKRLAMKTWQRFIVEHRKLQNSLATYLAGGRQGALRLNPAVFEEIEPEGAPFLFANNMDARIAFAEVAKRHFEKLLDRVGTFYWVTLIPKKYVVAEKDAPSFDPRILQGWVHHVLRGFSYFGIVEPAYYTNKGAIPGTNDKAVSMHTHHLLWGATERQVQARMAEINEEYVALLPGVEPALAVAVTGEDVIKCLLYMLKAPQCNYRFYPLKGDFQDLDTGEIITRGTGVFKQKKGAIRPGEMVRMCNVLVGKLLHKLTFAAGDGKAVHAAICKEALAPLRRQQARQDAIDAYCRAGFQADPRNRHR